MQNITSTRWIDNIHTSLSEIDELLQSDHPDSQTAANWQIEPEFPEPESITLNGKNVTYNLYSFSFDKITTGMPLDENVIRTTGFIIPYLLNGKIRYIISRNSGALTILRKVLSCSENNAIEKNCPLFTADMFMWMVSRVYRGDNILKCDSEQLDNLTIDSIRGFKGDTEDLLTRVSAVGESVINIISTLSFLLESQKLNQITLDVGYREHPNIEVSFSNKNTVSINLDRYQGSLIGEITSNKTIALLTLLLYLEIIPIILQSYQDEIENNQWGQDKCVDFLNSVAQKLSERVAQKVEELKTKPVQLHMCTGND